MATLLKPSYGASTAITITSAATLASLTAAGCAARDNTADLAVDAQLTILATLATGTPASDKLINIWFDGSEDGAHFSDNAQYSGADAAVTLNVPPNFRGPFVIATPSSGGLQWIAFVPSVLKFLGGLVMPRKWGFIVENRTGLAFTAFSATYSPLQLTNI
jgi:hypothetical protein